MIILAVFLAALISRATPQNLESPCPSVLQYGDILSDRWFARIAFPPLRQRWSTVDIVLDRQPGFLGSWLGQVTTQDNLEFRITNTESDGGQADSFQIFVTYDNSTGSPQVVQIRLDQQEIICDINNKKFANKPPASALEGQNYDQQLAQCGTVKIDQHLSPHVIDTLEGQWPWQAAIYKNQGDTIKYACGGTLVSHRHVISVAHNVYGYYVGGAHLTLDVKMIMVFVGAYNGGAQIKFVEKIISHPEYYYLKTLKNDLAILQFREPVQYSNWVQPACLWPDLISDLDRIVGKTGTVAGWDYVKSANLRLSQLTIVSQTDCLWSDPNFFSLTSNYTLCAELGNDNKTITCVGSSGNGLMLRINGAWHLRAMISLALQSEDTREARCDPGHKIVLTDVAQYLPWIKDNIEPFTNLFPASALGGQNYAQQLAQCGIVKIDKDLSPRVVETLEGQWPWQAVIYKNQGGKIQHSCGGTLVSRRHVITVAHCLTVKKSVPTTTLDVKIFMVFVGAYNLAASLDGVQIKLVEKVIIYPEYQSNILRNDLGILQFREPAQYSNWVQPVCLRPEPISDLDKIVGKNGTVAGWNFFSSDNLRLSQLTIVSGLTLTFLN